MKIAVSAISKNEVAFVERFMASCADADYVVIADTGSDDGTAELAHKCGATVYDISVKPWRFDVARNAALALIPADVDVIISLDLDEVLEPGWREEIERVWTPETTRLRYLFDWGCDITFYYEKIFAKNGYRFHHPVHEYPVPDGRITEVYAHTDKLIVRHLPDPTKSRGQYLDLLRLAVKEDPACPRNAFYFARELTFYRLWEEAIGALHSYLDMPGADWPNERCYAMRLLGQSYAERGETWEAMKWLRRATAEAPNTREPWADLAMQAYRLNDWDTCHHAAKSGLKITYKALVYTCDPSVWGAKLHDMAAISAYHLGLQEDAVIEAQNAVSHEPDNERLKSNLELIRGNRHQYDSDGFKFCRGSDWRVDQSEHPSDETGSASSIWGREIRLY
jgi:glycosyltransferase involved in cell wall biosynthesis